MSREEVQERRRKGAYINGLVTADRRGFSAGVNETNERNPYKRYEHARCWDEGFTRGMRAAKAGSGTRAIEI